MTTVPVSLPGDVEKALGGESILLLTEELLAHETGVVAEGNEAFFARLVEELPFELHRYPSGHSFNGWIVPDCWCVERALLERDGRVLFDGTAHPLGVAMHSHSFSGELSWEQLEPHLVTRPELPHAHGFHCAWAYRPWHADWALSVPAELYRRLGPGRYHVDLVTTRRPGEMIVAEYTHHGRSDRTIALAAHTCHPLQANDDMAGVALLVRLFQGLAARDTFYTYKLLLGPEHLGTVFYLRDRTPEEIARCVGGAFAEMPGSTGPIKIAASFGGDTVIDHAFRSAAGHHGGPSVLVGWREGAGNDETVWEAPGYEIPFVEVSRCEDQWMPYSEYHSSADTADRLDPAQLEVFAGVFRQAIEILETNCRLHRLFDGLVCLSNPDYGLYLERPDPAIDKGLAADSEKWGHLLDSLLRYFDGSMTILDIALRHDLPYPALRRYLRRFEHKGLIRMERAAIERTPPTRVTDTPRP